MKVVFMGTPSFAARVLELISSSEHNIEAVFCQPDKIGNRKKTVECEAARKAKELGLTVYKLKSVSKEGIEILREASPDIIITAAFGQMLSDEVLSCCKYGVINLHGSLLPRFRGASPVQSALISGSKLNGITVMRTVKKMDAGDILGYKIIELDENVTATEVFDIYAAEGARLLLEVMDKLASGALTAVPQNKVKYNVDNKTYVKPTYCKKLKKEDEIIDWSLSAEKVHNRIRGLSENPCAFTTLNGRVFKIYRSAIVNKRQKLGTLGEVIAADKNGLVVACGIGSIAILECCLEGGKRLGYKDFLNGKKIQSSDVLGEKL